MQKRQEKGVENGGNKCQKMSEGVQEADVGINQ